jgi:hypothetical protein
MLISTKACAVQVHRNVSFIAQRKREVPFYSEDPTTRMFNESTPSFFPIVHVMFGKVAGKALA